MPDITPLINKMYNHIISKRKSSLIGIERTHGDLTWHLENQFLKNLIQSFFERLSIEAQEGLINSDNNNFHIQSQTQAIAEQIYSQINQVMEYHLASDEALNQFEVRNNKDSKLTQPFRMEDPELLHSILSKSKNIAKNSEIQDEIAIEIFNHFTTRKFDGEETKFYRVVCNAIDGLLSKNNAEFDNQIIKSAIQFLDKNFDKLKNLDDKTLKYLGKKLNEVIEHSPPDLSHQQLLKKFESFDIDKLIIQANKESTPLFESLTRSSTERLIKIRTSFKEFLSRKPNIVEDSETQNHKSLAKVKNNQSNTR